MAQENDNGVTATDAIDFIDHQDVPQQCKITYANFIADLRPLKLEPNRIRCVVGGDKLDFMGDASSPTTILAEAKMLFNSVISDEKNGATFMTYDLKDHFLALPMAKPKCTKLRWEHIPDDIKIRYRLEKLLHYGYIFMKIKKGMYGLKEAAILAYKKLLLRLKPRGY